MKNSPNQKHKHSISSQPSVVRTPDDQLNMNVKSWAMKPLKMLRRIMAMKPMRIKSLRSKQNSHAAAACGLDDATEKVWEDDEAKPDMPNYVSLVFGDNLI